MTIENGLANIERVDLREIWPNEAADFTPWLAENLSDLGSVIGLDLELQEQEAPVGGYALDILARDVGSGGEVVIENQLGTTDHSHLGQLLTYAAGFDARVAVWIAREFKSEHREALDMLNRRTGEDTQFFGVEIELWKIGDSRPAPNFRLVAFPNEWRKRTVRTTGATGNVSPRRERYRQFFQRLMDTLREEHSFTNARSAQPQSWYFFSAGHAQRVQWGVSFAQGGRARVEVYIDNTDGDWNKRLYDRLHEQRRSVESELGDPLDWERLDDRRASRVAVYRDGSIDDSDDTLEEIHEWMVERLLKFREVFRPRLDELAK